MKMNIHNNKSIIQQKHATIINVYMPNKVKIHEANMTEWKVEIDKFIIRDFNILSQLLIELDKKVVMTKKIWKTLSTNLSNWPL